jgi:hypothetical protein
VASKKLVFSQCVDFGGGHTEVLQFAGANVCQEGHNGWIGGSSGLIDAFGCWEEAGGV